MATLQVNIGRVEKHAGRLGSATISRLCGMPGRSFLGPDRKPWLEARMTLYRAEGFVGLLDLWGVPKTAYRLRADKGETLETPEYRGEPNE